MKPAQLALYLLCCSTCATLSAKEEWLQGAIEERQATLRFFEENRTRVDAAILTLTDTLPAPLPTPTEEMPTSENGETVAEADGGMLFDTGNARMVYLQNVRVADARLRMRCADCLYIQLPKSTLKQGKEKVEDAIAPQHKAPTPRTEQTPPPAAEEKAVIPFLIETGTAMINTVSNRALLLGKTEGEFSLRIKQGDTGITLFSKDGAPAQLLADTNGDLYIISGGMDIRWKDAKGNTNTLVNENGIAYYRAQDNKLVLTGPTKLESSNGNFRCTEELCVRLVINRSEHSTGSKEDNIMPQFRNLSIAGIDGLTAHGEVYASRPAGENTPAVAVTGNSLSYDGKTGACSVHGKNTTLLYGNNKLYTDGSVQLAENGDITLQGTDIKGNYERPASGKDAAPIPGTFLTAGNLRFCAATGTVNIPAGVTLKDDFCTLTVSGAVTLKLARKPHATETKAHATEKEKRFEYGNINLAVAEYSEVESITATGGINLQYTQKRGEEGLTLVADDADINLLTGEITLSSEATRITKVKYNDNMLMAESSQGTTSLCLSTNGDLTMLGEKLTATIPLGTEDKKNAAASTAKFATVHCTERLTLVRESGKLEMGAGTRIESPEATITSTGPLFLTLRRDTTKEAKPIIARYPHLVYNFTGLQQADTANGGTIQSEKAALRCTGRIHVLMREQQDTQDSSPLAAIQLAEAEGDVAIAAKDEAGKTIHAFGDKLSINGITGVKKLTGTRVVLRDAHNSHTASGANAAVVVDKHNNIRITGAKHTTTATNIQKQAEKQDKNKKKK